MRYTGPTCHTNSASPIRVPPRVAPSVGITRTTPNPPPLIVPLSTLNPRQQNPPSPRKPNTPERFKQIPPFISSVVNDSQVSCPSNIVVKEESRDSLSEKRPRHVKAESH